MADEKTPSITDNLNMSSSGMEAPSVGTTGSPAPAEDKFNGKSREEIYDAYKNLESKYAEQGTETGQLRDFIGRVGMFFKVDGEQVTLNDDVLKKYAEVQGWLPKERADNPKLNASTADGDGLVFEPNEQKTIQEMIRQEIKDSFRESLEPLQQQFAATQQNQWIDKVASRHPEFVNYKTKVGDFLNKTGFKVNSAEDLEKAYIATRALSGDMVDKKQTESHIQELQKTLQTLTPGARGPMRNPAELSNAELLGLGSIDTPEAKALQALTGKPYFKD
jgi:hypothetical protein